MHNNVQHMFKNMQNLCKQTVKIMCEGARAQPLAPSHIIFTCVARCLHICGTLCGQFCHIFAHMICTLFSRYVHIMLHIASIAFSYFYFFVISTSIQCTIFTHLKSSCFGTHLLQTAITIQQKYKQPFQAPVGSEALPEKHFLTPGGPKCCQSDVFERQAALKLCQSDIFERQAAPRHA